MICQDQEPLIAQVCAFFERISSLPSLEPCHDVNTLFTELVDLCTPPNPIDVTKLCARIQTMRSSLINLCGRAEGLLEAHYSKILAARQNPIQNLDIFPYYDNYLKLSKLEFDILSRHFAGGKLPENVAFVGSGPLPLSSIVLATNHLPEANFYNYDIDPKANSDAETLVSSDLDLSKRMFFLTSDVMDVTSALKSYDVVFLAALVGMELKEKVRAIEHLARHMAPGALLMLRSAHGARAFLYPIVEPRHLKGFEVLDVYHPTDEVINSVVIARKLGNNNNNNSRPMNMVKISPVMPSSTVLPTKCCHEIQFEGMFNPLKNVHGSMIEELAFEDKM